MSPRQQLSQAILAPVEFPPAIIGTVEIKLTLHTIRGYRTADGKHLLCADDVLKCFEPPEGGEGEQAV